MAKKKTNKQKKPKNQAGGMLPGLIARYIIAKKLKKKFDALKYMKGAIGGRIAVGKAVAGKKVPTPGNTGMSAGKFFKSGLFGI